MRKIYSLVLITLCIASCLREEMQELDASVNQKAGVIYFTHNDYEQVNVTTKATLDLIPESRIQNLFVYIFDSSGKRLYAHFFDVDNKLSSQSEVENTDKNCWTVTNRSSNTPGDPETSGYIKIKAPYCTDGTIYVVANIDADMVNISPEKLNTVRAIDDLDDLTASLNQEITSRNGYFPMSFKSGIDINNDGTVNLDEEMQLVRLDAKVTVSFRVATDNELEKTEDGVTSTQTLKEFIPESWRVVNIPKGTYVFEKDSDYEEAGYFDTEPVVFESKGTADFTYTDNGGVNHTVNSPINGFSFYMLENREDATASTGGNYHFRDKREKDADGRYTTGPDGGIWVNAPEYGTYLEVKGEVVMIVDVSSEAKQQQLSAAVTYYIHLGDLTESMDNYSINRNTIYNYTITIKGVSEIETEVTTSNLTGVGPNHTDFKENETGATGQVYIAKESIYTFDAHYGQRVFCFDAAYIDPDNVTWYVKTPFGKEGIPEKVGDTEVPAGMDYKWVHFLVNKEDVDDGNVSYIATGLRPYSQNNLPWPGDPYDGEKYDYYEINYGISEDDLMNVVEFTAYIKEQKRMFEKGLPSDFKREFDKDWLDWYNENHGTSITEADATSSSNYATYKDMPWWRDRIYMTVFVDEFYYDKDPITGTEREGLWKEFVNQPNRIMHILCDNMKSYDKESSATGSVITLRQTSIQTPYNITNAETAWGCETVDEFNESYLWYFYEDETRANPGLPTTPAAKGNNSDSNGLFNTVKLLGLSFDGTEEWGKYMTYTYPNDYKGSGTYATYFLNDGYRTLLYSVLQRNRDNNGNGAIDPSEIRWYQAALEQLFGLYIGGLGLSEDSQLYPPKIASYGNDEVFESGHPFSGCYKWMLKVISSTCRADGGTGDYLPVTIWAEEGVSISQYKRSFGWNLSTQSPYSIRCVRNLGLDIPDASSINDVSKNIASALMKAENTSSGFRFDLRNINKKSVRFYTTKELEPGNEDSEMSRVYYGFEVAEEMVSFSGGYPALKTQLESGSSPCPSGWRVPNVREGGLMYLYGSAYSLLPNNTFVSSYISLGAYDKQRKTHYSWYFGNNFATIDHEQTTTSHIRCVKDSHPDTW